MLEKGSSEVSVNISCSHTLVCSGSSLYLLCNSFFKFKPSYSPSSTDADYSPKFSTIAALFSLYLYFTDLKGFIFNKSLFSLE